MIGRWAIEAFKNGKIEKPSELKVGATKRVEVGSLLI
jgi:hypothetical protein